MKKIILILGIILLGMSCNNEQKRIDKMTNKLLTRISNACQLSSDQVTKIKPIAVNFIKTRKETKAKFENDQNALKNAMETGRNKFMDTLKSILSPDQYDKLKASFQQQKNRQNGQGGEQESEGKD